MIKFRDFIYNQHDVVCNQKYGDNLPYSFHLKRVGEQGKNFLYLIKGVCSNQENYRASLVTYIDIVGMALISHDAIEDARLTYNNILTEANNTLENYVAAKMVADIVYCVTDEKGKSREERKNELYYQGLVENELAVFVKLADLAANTLYSKLTASRMYGQYKEEFPRFKEKVYLEKYKDFFDYVENL